MAQRFARLIAALVLAVLALMIVGRRVLLSASLVGALSRGVPATRPAALPAHGDASASVAPPSDDSSGSLHAAADGVSPAALLQCPGRCSGVGTCDEVRGVCACPPTRSGPACAERTMPACEAGEGSINLSVLGTQLFWDRVPSLASGKEPPVRWLGPLPCACVLQAMGALSGVHSGAFSPWWGAASDMLYVARVPCLRSPARATVADLAHDGLGGGRGRWAAVAVLGWDFKLANNPYLLLPPLREHVLWAPARWASAPAAEAPPRQLDESAVSATWAAELQRDASAPDPGAAGVAAAVSDLANAPVGWRAPLALRAASDCAGSCHGGGWCVADGGGGGGAGEARGGFRGDAQAGTEGTRCECFSRIGAELDSPQLEGALHSSGRFGPDVWRRWHWSRHYDHLDALLPNCPNRCGGVGTCEYGFCACPDGRWGLDCGLSRERALAELAAKSQGEPTGPRPRIFVYNTPAVLRRACSPWVLPEMLGDALLRSEHTTALAVDADFYWLYGCSLAGSLVVPALDWMRLSAPHFNATAAARKRRAGGGQRGTHLFVSPSEHGWAEAWQAVWFGRGVHAALSPAHLRPGSEWWRQLAPDSAERLVGSLQLEGAADTRFKREFPPCHICFQRGKDVMIPAFRGVNDYPTERECLRLRRGLSPWARSGLGEPAVPEPDFEAGRATDLFFAGAIQTKKDVQPSRFEPWRLWRNESGFRLLQTEKHPFVVDPADGWFDKVDLYQELRAAKACMVPMGKTALYALM
ncbi:hypothetical protein T492DRAFT_844224 [Pavlovales sp. CCMP2436]|nr:hypothetical protein T492DRAFT_844224 [Pavlovales sp. CCMP2436]